MGIIDDAIIRVYANDWVDIEFALRKQATRAMRICRKSKLHAVRWPDEPTVISVQCAIGTARKLCKLMGIKHEWYESTTPNWEENKR